MGKIHYTIGKPLRVDENGEPLLYRVEKVFTVGTATGLTRFRSLAYHLHWNERHCQYDITIASDGNYGDSVGWIKACRDSNRKGSWVARQSYDLDHIAPGGLVWGEGFAETLNRFLK